MKNKKFWVSLLAGLLAALMIFGIIAGALPSYVSAAKSSAEIQQEINQMKEQLKNNKSEVAKLEGQLSANMDKMEDIVENKNLIDQQIFLLHEQVQNLNKQITAYSSLIADKQAELDQATANWKQLSDKHKERIRAMEEDGKLSYWSVLFKANSFSDFLDRLSMIEEIAAADQRRIKELNDAAKVVEEAKIGLENEKIALEASRKEMESASAELEKSREEADQLLKQLIATGEEYQKLLDEAERKESQTAGKIDSLESAYDAAKEREYQEWLASQPPVQTGGSSNTVDGVTWLLPINYTRFSSPFGYRIHPIYGDWRFHYGVDLSAPQGTPIYATRGGRVTYATYDSSSGYYVSINHLDGFVSKYLHMTHYIVSPGQYVAAGQIIGYCGSTGASTGPHLHFSLYYNGSAVNPAKYINIK
jgi:murein DD-endopeptidase MepM/ murein hydrolase activator NlpD